MPLNNPPRLALQRYITDLIAAIREDDGYSTATLEGKVFRGRASFGAEDPIPMVSLLEPEEVPEFTQSGGLGMPRIGAYDLILQGWVDDDPNNPTDPAHFLAADVTRCLAIEKRKDDTSAMLGGFARDLQISPAVCRPANEFSTKANFMLRLSMRLTEDLENPFA